MPSGRMTGLGDAVDACLIKLMFLYHQNVKALGAEESNRFFGASDIGNEYL